MMEGLFRWRKVWLNQGSIPGPWPPTMHMSFIYISYIKTYKYNLFALGSKEGVYN